jgi:hypothetical protein
VVLLKSMNNQGTGSRFGSMESTGVMGSSPLPGGSMVPPTSQPSPPLPQPQGDQTPRSASIHVFGSDSGVLDHDARRTWISKMDFPKFDGSVVRIWLDKCSAYFQLYSILHDFHVIAASMHMLDKASHWFQTYKHSPRVHTWEHFVVAVSQEFEVNTHRVKTMELLNLKQIGSVEDYKNQFDKLVYHILLYDKSLSETVLVS